MKLSWLLECKCLFLVLLLSWSPCNGESSSLYNEENVGSFMADMWLEGGDILRMLWRDCSKKLIEAKEAMDMKEYFPQFMKCMKKKTLVALDRSLSTDIVPLTEGVNLVRYELVDRQGKVMHSSENDTAHSSWSEQEIEAGSWRLLALERMARVLRTHVIKLDFSGEEQNLPEKTEFRHRRRQQMMTMMMFGIISMGMVLVPMGFQFLAVLGGKALLLAKMALILSSIQGLKKVDDWNRISLSTEKASANPLNYGYYHSYPPPYEHYDKRSHGGGGGGGAGGWPEPSVLPGKAPPPVASYEPWPIGEGLAALKLDRINTESRTWRPELPKPVKRSQESPREPRLYPVYPSGMSSAGADAAFFGALDAPAPLADLTTTPGEVQAEYTIDLPVNRIHFQSPNTLVSA